MSFTFVSVRKFAGHSTQHQTIAQAGFNKKAQRNKKDIRSHERCILDFHTN